MRGYWGKKLSLSIFHTRREKWLTKVTYDLPLFSAGVEFYLMIFFFQISPFGCTAGAKKIGPKK
jgi:hypothetical protein